MATKGGVSLPAKKSNNNNKNNKSNDGILARVSSTISESQIVAHGRKAVDTAWEVSGKLITSTGRAAWHAGITFLILGVPLIIEMDREQQLNELELQQASLLGTPGMGPLGK